MFKGDNADEKHITKRTKLSSEHWRILPTRLREPLRSFIATTAEVAALVGFQNKKDHPEGCASAFEINYGMAKWSPLPTRSAIQN